MKPTKPLFECENDSGDKILIYVVLKGRHFPYLGVNENSNLCDSWNEKFLRNIPPEYRITKEEPKPVRKYRDLFLKRNSDEVVAPIMPFDNCGGFFIPLYRDEQGKFYTEE